MVGLTSSLLVCPYVVFFSPSDGGRCCRGLVVVAKLGISGGNMNVRTLVEHYDEGSDSSQVAEQPPKGKKTAN